MSTHSNYGDIAVKNVNLSEKIISHGTADNDYEMSLTFPNVASDVEVSLPTVSSNCEILVDSSQIAVSQIDLDNASEETSPEAADALWLNDGTDNKKVTIQNLANMSEFQSLPDGSSSEFIVYDSADTAQAVDMSGDATLDNSGAITLADKPSVEKVCEANKFIHLDSNRDCSNINVLEATTVAGDNVEVGNSTTRWQFNIDSSGHLELRYSSDSGSTWATKQVFNNA